MTNTVKTTMNKLYTTEKELVGWNPDGPNYPEDDGKIIIPEGSILIGTDVFDEYSMEFIINEGCVTVALPRERVCDDVESPNYYANYFSLPQGLKEVIGPLDRR